jgi:hypothetical protein
VGKRLANYLASDQAGAAGDVDLHREVMP